MHVCVNLSCFASTMSHFDWSSQTRKSDAFELLRGARGCLCVSSRYLTRRTLCIAAEGDPETKVFHYHHFISYLFHRI